MFFGVANPSISATYGIFAASAVGGFGLMKQQFKQEA
jgi:hypothetical protein